MSPAGDENPSPRDWPCPPDIGGAPPTLSSASASLVFGILGLVLIGPFGSIPAVVLGRCARRRISAEPGKHGGLGLAKAGMVLGYIQLGIMLLLAGSIPFSYPAFHRARREARAKECAANIARIANAKDHWAMEQNAHDGMPVKAEEVIALAPLKGMPICPAGGTYCFGVVGDSPSCSIHGLSAVPRPPRPPVEPEVPRLPKKVTAEDALALIRDRGYEYEHDRLDSVVEHRDRYVMVFSLEPENPSLAELVTVFKDAEKLFWSRTHIARPSPPSSVLSPQARQSLLATDEPDGESPALAHGDMKVWPDPPELALYYFRDVGHLARFEDKLLREGDSVRIVRDGVTYAWRIAHISHAGAVLERMSGVTN